jgi:hypothetical protein
VVKWKVAAALAASVLLFGTMPGAAGDLDPDAQTAGLSSHDSAYGVLQANGHAKRSVPLRDVAVGVQAFQLSPPTGALAFLTRFVDLAPRPVRNDGAGIRGPPPA